MPSKRRRIRVTEGSGNVFADVGIDQPEEYLANAELARHIIGALGAQRLTQIGFLPERAATTSSTSTSCGTT